MPSLAAEGAALAEDGPAGASPSPASGRSGGDGDVSVKVYCRVRPQNAIETKRGGKPCVKVKGEQVTVKTREQGDHTFTFDTIFGPDSTQEAVYGAVGLPIVEAVLQGYNATIFAYGQTGSGKTHTMSGPSMDDPVQKGIIPRTITSLFEGCENASEEMEFTLQVGFLEIYLERIRDLLDPQNVNLQIREKKDKGVYVEGVTALYVTSEKEMFDLMVEAATNRQTAATGMNEGSSRSHSVSIITVTQKNTTTQSVKEGKLYLVDLAGSEMVRKTGATGQQLEEAKMINKSLSALGQVINALTDKLSSHIPYRDSKLTRVLQDSLGGNAKTALVINVSPSSYNASEILSTLRFGNRAKSIKNQARVNQMRSIEELEALLKRAEKAIDMQQGYITMLEEQLADMAVRFRRLVVVSVVGPGRG